MAHINLVFSMAAALTLASGCSLHGNSFGNTTSPSSASQSKTISAKAKSQAQPAGTTVLTLTPTSAAAAQMTLNWMDRRPIGQMMLSASVSGNGAYEDGFPAGNLRGWFGDRSIDVINNLPGFQQRFLESATQGVAYLNSMNAQGVIVWDVEGEEYPQQTTYIGDPTLVPQMAPELESIVNVSGSPYNGMKLIDAYFKTYTDAGLRVGVNVRAQQMEFNNSTDCGQPGDLWNTCQPFLTDLSQMQTILMSKIAYAKQNWGATLFYSDSSVLADQYWNCEPSDCNNDWTQCPAQCPGYPPLLESGGRSRMGGSAIPYSVFQAVAAANPDVLIIPEENTTGYYTGVSPLVQIFQAESNGVPGRTSDATLAQYPGGFSSFIIDNSTQTLSPGNSYYNDLVTGAQNGDIMITAAWWPLNEGLANQIYTQAKSAGLVPRVIPVGAVQAYAYSSSSVAIQWTTSNAANAQVLYGTSQNYDSSSSTSSSLTTQQAITLNGLQPNTTYHFAVKSVDAFGNVGQSPDQSFTTGSSSTSGSGISIASNGVSTVPLQNYSSISGMANDANGLPFDIGYVNAGGDVIYSLNVAQAGNYSIVVNYASPSGNTGVNLDANGSSLASVSFAATGGYGSYVNASPVVVALPAGSVSFEVQAQNSGFNLGGLSFTPVNTTSSGNFSPIRIVAAQSNPVTDSFGNVWSADTDYSGGNAWVSSNTVNNTPDSSLYQGERWGQFSYSIPVTNGAYNVDLKFAELYWSAAGQRVFNVQINGQQVLSNFDIFAASGGMFNALDEIFPVTVTNGAVNITFTAIVDSPKLDAIQITSAGSNSGAPLYALRAATTGYTDNSGVQWSADEDFSGGSFGAVTSQNITNTSNSPLYQSERYGNMTYNFSVPNGTHQVTLKFAEIYWSSVGQRVFNVSINGSQVLTNFDIVKSAGGAFAATDQQFTVNVSNGQLAIQFSSVVDSAKISAIEIN